MSNVLIKLWVIADRDTGRLKWSANGRGNYATRSKAEAELRRLQKNWPDTRYGRYEVVELTGMTTGGNDDRTSP